LHATLSVLNICGYILKRARDGGHCYKLAFVTHSIIVKVFVLQTFPTMNISIAPNLIQFLVASLHANCRGQGRE